MLSRIETKHKTKLPFKIKPLADAFLFHQKFNQIQGLKFSARHTTLLFGYKYVFGSGEFKGYSSLFHIEGYSKKNLVLKSVEPHKSSVKFGLFSTPSLLLFHSNQGCAGPPDNSQPELPELIGLGYGLGLKTKLVQLG